MRSKLVFRSEQLSNAQTEQGYVLIEYEKQSEAEDIISASTAPSSWDGASAGVQPRAAAQTVDGPLLCCFFCIVCFLCSFALPPLVRCMLRDALSVLLCDGHTDASATSDAAAPSAAWPPERCQPAFLLSVCLCLR